MLWNRIHHKKGCVFFAAFFMISACQENNSNSDKQNGQALQSVQSIIKNAEQQPSINPPKETTQISEQTSSEQANSENINKSEPVADVFLTVNPKDPAQTSFSCDDQIYLTIKFANHQPKLHQINISWKDPNDQERESNSFPFFVTQKESVAWASLKLHRSAGAGMLQWINPAAGMEEFIGQWTVDVKVGSILNETHEFEILC